MKNKIYLVTGIAGNLGSSVAERLLADGKKVRGLVLNGDPAATRIPKEVDVFVGDVTDTESLERFFSVPADTDIICIHCAAIVTVNPNYSPKVYAVNVQGTQNIVTMCLTHHAVKLVHVSSTGAIPEIPGNKPITEPDTFNPDLVTGYYGKSKTLGSLIVLDAVKNSNLDASIVFPTGICGPDDYAFGPVASFLIDYCAGKLTAGVAGSFNAVDVRDLADAIVECTETGRKGEGYILGNECVSMERMFHILAELTNTKEVTTIVPAGIAKIIGKASDIIEHITKRPQRMTSFAVYNLIRNNNFDCSKARAELKFKTRPFDETISDTIAWLACEGKITITKKRQTA